MKLSTKVRYGTRAMLDLAINYSDVPVFLKDIARRQEISKKYLERIFSSLKAAGLVKTMRGAKGGFALNVPLSKITLSQIVEAIDGAIDLVECTRNKSACKRSDFCTAREVWYELTKIIKDKLDSVTLEDLVKREKEKKKISLSMYHI